MAEFHHVEDPADPRLGDYRDLRDAINQARNRSQQLSLIQSMTTADMARMAS